MAAAETEAEAGSEVLTGVTRGGAGLATGDLAGGALVAERGGDTTGAGRGLEVLTGDESGSDEGDAEGDAAAAVGGVPRGFGGGDALSRDSVELGAAAETGNGNAEGETFPSVAGDEEELEAEGGGEVEGGEENETGRERPGRRRAW